MSDVYRVPDLAEVTVATGVLPHLRETIEFQLGHFRVPEAAAPIGGLPRISVAPYGEFEGAGAIRFHTACGEVGALLHEPLRRHATMQTDVGFAVFSDTPEVLIVLLLQVLALRSERTFLHAAGWCDPGGAVTLVPGPGGVGKTALLSAAVLRHGARLLGDDLVTVGREGAAAFPRAFVLKDYHRSLFPAEFAAADTAETRAAVMRRWLVRFARENAPFHGVVKALFARFGRVDGASLWLQRQSQAAEFHAVPVARLFGADRVAAGGPIRRVVYLERHYGPFRLENFEAGAVVRRSVAVLHHEWADYLRWFCTLGALDLVDVSGCVRGAEAAMRTAFEGAEILRLQVPVEATPEELERVWAERIGFLVDAR